MTPGGPCRACAGGVPGVVLPRSPDNAAIRPGGCVSLLVRLTWAGQWEEQFHTSWKEACIVCHPCMSYSLKLLKLFLLLAHVPAGMSHWQHSGACALRSHSACAISIDSSFKGSRPCSLFCLALLCRTSASAECMNGGEKLFNSV